MWKCGSCGENIDEGFETCWKCGTAQDGTPPSDPEMYEEQVLDTNAHPELKCPICGQVSFSWGSLDGVDTVLIESPQLTLAVGNRMKRKPVQARHCDDCGNVQLFSRG